MDNVAVEIIGGVDGPTDININPIFDIAFIVIILTLILNIYWLVKKL